MSNGPEDRKELTPLPYGDEGRELKFGLMIHTILIIVVQA